MNSVFVLKNRVYTGKLCIKRTGELFDGRHEAIIDEKQFEAAQKALDENRCYEGKTMKHTMFAPLKGAVQPRSSTICSSSGKTIEEVAATYYSFEERRGNHFRLYWLLHFATIFSIIILNN